MKNKLYESISIRLYQEGKGFGPGIAELLERVQEHHSLRAAAQSMAMAYSKAWTMVKNCETALGRKLLCYTTGGRHGGGAELTEDAEQMLRAYRDYCEAVRTEADKLFPAYFGPFLED